MTAINSRRFQIWAASLVTSTISFGCSDNNDHLDAAIPFDVLSIAPGTVTKTPLVSDVAAPGVTVDPNLVNAWGLAFSPAGPIWVADNHTGVATVYNADGTIVPLVVRLPVPAGDTNPAAPTGQQFNSVATDFLGDKFVLSSEDGTIIGWQTGTTGVLRVDKSADGAVYKGFDFVDTGAGRVIVAANFAKNTIDVFDANYMPVRLPEGKYKDPSPLAGFAPFNVMAAGDNVYVSYAKQNAAKHDDVAGLGNGAINVFDKTGTFVRRLITGGALNSPWGMAIVPSDYPRIAGTLLVGNFGDGRIGAYNLTTGALVAPLVDNRGAEIVIDGLWALRFGLDVAGMSHLQTFYTAGPVMETHGVLGRLDAVP